MNLYDVAELNFSTPPNVSSGTIASDLIIFSCAKAPSDDPCAIKHAGCWRAMAKKTQLTLRRCKLAATKASGTRLLTTCGGGGGGGVMPSGGLVLMIPFGPSIEMSRYSTSPSCTCRRRQRERHKDREAERETERDTQRETRHTKRQRQRERGGGEGRG